MLFRSELDGRMDVKQKRAWIDLLVRARKDSYKRWGKEDIHRGLFASFEEEAEGLLEKYLDEVEAMRAEFRARRDRVVEMISRMPLVRCTPPEGSMFLMIDIRETGLASEDFAFRLVEAEGVSLLPCDGFGPSAIGHLRLSLSASMERLVEACRRLERFLRGLNR